MKTAILLDSSFYMEKEIAQQYGFYFVRLMVNFEDTTYKETSTKKEQIKEVFERVKTEKSLPKTSQPSAQDFLDKFEEIKNDGYDRIIVMTISGKLSGTVQGATVAANMYKEEVGGIDIDVFDSINVAQPAAIAAIEVAKAVASNQEISNDEVKAIIDHYSKNSKIYLMVDTLDFLAYGGRISNTIAAIGNIFGIKPILEVKEGEILEFAKARSMKKAYQTILNELETRTSDEDDFYLLATHTEAEKEARKLLKVAEKQRPNSDQSFETISLGPVVGIHVGPGAVAIVWAPKYKADQLGE